LRLPCRRLASLELLLLPLAIVGGTASSARADDVPVVQVLAPHRDVGETTVRREDTRELPGTFGDPTRVAEMLPGVVPTASGLQAFFVRGAPPEATGYFIDGVPVPALYHVGFGPSVIHPGLLGRVDFYQGAPPAAYGRYVGGVLAATTAPPESRPHAEANVRLFDAGALGEAPFAEGRGSALAAARYGYPGSVLPLFATDTGLSYWDYQARATWSASDRDRLTAFVFGSYDKLTQKQTDTSGNSYWQQLVADEFHRADLRWDRTLGPSSTMRLAVTVGRDAVGDDVANATQDSARARVELDTRPARDLRVRAGADVASERLRPGSAPPGAPPGAAQIAVSRDAVVVGLHADAAWRLSRAVEITPGVRADIYSSTLYASPSVAVLPGTVGGSAAPAIDPRLAARIRLWPSLTSVSTFGVSHQMPSVIAQYPEATPFLQPGVVTGIESSVQASQGLEIALPARFSAAATAFVHDYFGLPDITACGYSFVQPSQCVIPTVSARAYGLELLVRRALTERLTAWVSYTLSRSTRRAHLPGPNPSSEPTIEIASEYDRTHVLSAAASFDMGRAWRVGARLFAYSGRPYTAFSRDQPIVPFDSQRLPGFFRLDARVEKAWVLGNGTRISAVLEGINVTLNKETVSAECGGPAATAAGRAGAAGGLGRSGGIPGAVLQASAKAGVPANACTFDTIGPITIPSVGLEATFR
jgi:hypothetical protein